MSSYETGKIRPSCRSVSTLRRTNDTACIPPPLKRSRTDCAELSANKTRADSEHRPTPHRMTAQSQAQALRGIRTAIWRFSVAEILRPTSHLDHAIPARLPRDTAAVLWILTCHRFLTFRCKAPAVAITFPLTERLTSAPAE